MSGALLMVYQNLRSTSGPAQWMAKLSGTTYGSANPLVKADGSIYTFHAFPYNDPDSGLDFAACTVVLYNSSGTLVTSRTYRFAAEYALSTSSVNGAVLNSDGTITILGTYTKSVQQGYIITIAADLSSSNIREYVGASGNNMVLESLTAYDSTNNLGAGKYGSSNGTPFLNLSLLTDNSSSNRYGIGNPDSGTQSSSIFCAAGTSAGYFGAFSSGTTPGALKVAKFTTAGVLAWKKRFTGANLRASGMSIIPTEDTGIVVACSTSVILKINTDGTLAWAKTLIITGYTQGSVKIDGSYVYLTGYATGFVYITRLNFSDGAINYVNQITSPQGVGRLGDITMSGDNMYIVGSGPSIIKVPKDGTQTGTYTATGGNTYVYEAASGTVTTPSITVADFTASSSQPYTTSATSVSEGGTGFSSTLYLK